jgi:hypothetical protein
VTVTAVDIIALNSIAGNTVAIYRFGEGDKIISVNRIVAHRTAISDLAMIPAATSNPIPICSLLTGD